MYIFAHLGIPVFLSIFLYLSISFVLIGSLLPDVIDKPLFLLGLTPCSRFFGHSLTFALLATLGTYLITKKKIFTIAILFGLLFHLALDTNGLVPFFYPIINYTFDCKTIQIDLTPFVIFVETSGLILIILTMKYKNQLIKYRDKLYSRLKKSLLK